jgi:hypothetical protein
MQLVKDARTAAGAGASGLTIWISDSNDVSLGEYALRSWRLNAMQLDHVNNQYRLRGETPVDGIIGADILAKGEAVIDYVHLRLYLR